MCQFCGVDPAFATYFDSPEQQIADTSSVAPTTSAPNFFRLKKTNKRYRGLTTQQLTTFASSLSPNARLYMGHHREPYQQVLRRWSKCAVKAALAVVRVATAEDVAKTIMMANSHSVPFVVKCGGHSPGGASSAGENGLVIDLGLLSDVSVKPDEQLVIAGGGCLSGDVNKAAAEYGLACGNPHNHGLTTIYVLRRLAVDNIVAAEVVTANGQVLWASKEDNQELFWAIRGAGNRFGVVTKFVIKAHPITDLVWGGVLMYTGDQLDSVVAAANTWFSQRDKKAVAGLALGKGPDGQVGLTVLPFYNGTQAQGEENFAPFLKINPVFQDTSVMPYWKINTLCDEAGLYAEDNIRFASANIQPPLSADHLRGALDSLSRLYATVPTSDKSGALILLVQPDGIEKQARTDMAYCWRDKNFDVGIAARWGAHDQEESVIKWMREFQAHLVTMGDEFRLYSNHSDFEGPSSKEFGINYLKLCELKKKWDPENVFKSL
ncbi:hypothetical protein DFQ28_002823 [Apophysomyces sp. BC1034]|nr:hypothetical protein DFQ30_003110 [Apophysomyces sp. BC1015]KAG0179497.1 hypothetical protein DFQ29_002041 [Apophysomyces sp. BC1021]KAG0189848.1 hypothetical protein DFQ28_002823 [Apophysomyces sp. BC1034]